MMLTRREALLFLSLLAAGAPFAKAANADRPKNVILVTGGDYMRYRRILEATVAGLEALGLVRDMPHVPDSDREGTSDIWEALTRATGAMRFLPDGHYSYAWDKAVREKVNAEIAERLRTRRDVDLIFTFGTEAGLDIPKLTSGIPILSLGSSNPVQTGIVASETDSGRENLHALVRRDPYGEEVRGLHALRPFRRLALVVAASSVEKAGAGEVEASCRSLGAGLRTPTTAKEPPSASRTFSKPFARRTAADATRSSFTGSGRPRTNMQSLRVSLRNTQWRALRSRERSSSSTESCLASGTKVSRATAPLKRT